MPRQALTPHWIWRSAPGWHFVLGVDLPVEMPADGGAYAPLAGGEEEQEPLAAAVVARNDTPASHPPAIGRSRSLRSRSLRWLVDEAQAVPEPAPVIRVTTDAQLLGTIEGAAEGAETSMLKTVMYYGPEATADGWRTFAERAQELQAHGTMTRDLELEVGHCDLSDGQLGQLAGLALSKLTLVCTSRVSGADVAAFAARARELQERGMMTRDLELVVKGCNWSDGQLGQLAGLALSKLTLFGTKGVSSADVAAFAERARELQERGMMTCDLELAAKDCGWDMDQLRAALSKGGPSYRSIALPDGQRFYADWTRLVARKLADQEHHPITQLAVSSGPELSAFLELVATILRSISMCPAATAPANTPAGDEQRIAIKLSAELRKKYPAVDKVVNVSGTTISNGTVCDMTLRQSLSDLAEKVHSSSPTLQSRIISRTSRPLLTLMWGGIGAGKTTAAPLFLDKIGKHPDEFAELGVDDLIELLPGYQSAIDSDDAATRQAAYMQHRKEAKALMPEYLAAAVSCRRNICTSSGQNRRNTHITPSLLVCPLDI
eukprot:COSAG06_NODE_515_length_14818_cov_1329.391263_9_plen_549_part_00